MKILITGANGFIGKNLLISLIEKKEHEIFTFVRTDSLLHLKKCLNKVDIIFHLAGVNRTENPDDFYNTNSELTKIITDYLIEKKLSPAIIFSSSTKILESPSSEYSKSKLTAENYLTNLNHVNNNLVCIYRLPNVFGKWSKPNYNSVVATFANNVINGDELIISDESKVINLCYIDDLIHIFLQKIKKIKKVKKINHIHKVSKCFIKKKYECNLKKLASYFIEFKKNNDNNFLPQAGGGIQRKLYATYLSFLPERDFVNKLRINSDPRGDFIELFKTKNNGQFSFFSCKPGQTRGQHYHHTKNEIFYVISGDAKFIFKNILSKKEITFNISGGSGEVIRSIPGWQHAIKNIGSTDVSVLLWSNEVFSKLKPDTIYSEI